MNKGFFDIYDTKQKKNKRYAILKIFKNNPEKSVIALRILF